MSVKPALTAEEWANSLFVRGPAVGGTEVMMDRRGRLIVGTEGYFTPCGDGEEYRTGAEYKFSGESRHALAALALHGQPFGFTWEMVDALREAFESWHASMVDAADSMDAPVFAPPAVSARHDAILAAIDLIAALLPPRDSTPL